MENKLDILLENLELNENDNLKKLLLNRVIVDVDDNFIFILESNHLLSYEDFSLLQINKNKFPYPCDFRFEVADLQCNQEDWGLYCSYVLTNLQAKNGINLQVDLDSIVLSDSIVIKALNGIQMDQLKKHKIQIEDEFEKVGIKKDVTFEICLDDKLEQQQVKMDAYREVEIDISSIPVAAKVVKNDQPFRRKQAFDGVFTNLSDIGQDSLEQKIKIRGFIFKTDLVSLRNGKHLQSLWITDYSDSIIVKRFEDERNAPLSEMKIVEKGKVWVEVIGDVKYDAYIKQTIIMARSVTVVKTPFVRKDESSVKRVELHVHSKMSTMDGISSVSDYIKTAASWGHKAIAITDHGNVQSFPEAQHSSKANGIKMIYGVEMYMVDPDFKTVTNAVDCSLEDATYVCFDLETTGLSVYHDGITEFGAVKIKNGEVIERLQSFINPEKLISEKISKLTSITNDMVKDAPTIGEYIDNILDFFGDAILVAHNATFDIGFLNEKLTKMNRPLLTNSVIDSLVLARTLLSIKTYRLGSVCRYYKVNYDDDVAHRADYDAEVLASVFNLMIYQMMSDGKYNLLDVAAMEVKDPYKVQFPMHVTALAINRVGLKNMFKAISESNTIYYHNDARIPRDRLQLYREGLLIGSSCYVGEVFDRALYGSDIELEKAIEFYDYIEIQPLDDYYHLVDRAKIDNMDIVILSIKRILSIAEKLNKIIVGTGDVHFVNKEQQIYRDVFISNPTIGISHRAHPLCNRKNPKAYTPCQYFRTTDEMLSCYPYLTDDKAFEYVVTNTNKIADMIEEIKPVHDKLFTPHIDGADDELRKICYDNAHKLYGNTLPDIVSNRLEKELENIIKHGFGVIYYISHKLVKKSNDDGYLVGSRGSVGSSFVATMSGITEVNPLPPHYVCLSCCYSEFFGEGEVANGYDLVDKNCPKCGKPLKGDGHNIPFETFLGFEADKVPDIDLNFSGAYQSIAHDYTKVLFGEDKVFRAGTISTVAEKTAFGYARGYSELMGTQSTIRIAEIERIASGCGGVKRTTGQHPGGIIVIPNDMDVFDFTPVQFPADDINSQWKTTHFDFHAIHDNVLKLDILGHVDPTVIRALQDLTGIDPKSIPTNDERVMSLFNSTKEMGINLDFMNCKTGALGLPEFGTSFVRGMLEQTKPKNFSDLVVISGLSHGTDVYLGNAEMLIKQGTCTLSDVIGCRDDIMVYLIEKGLPNKDAFDIMEVVRKGNSSRIFPEKDYEKLMLDNNVPQWYIDSCKKIKYMFPKAHAAAYVLSAVRVAWWKLYYPREYYAVYFTTRCNAYELETLVKGKDSILARRSEIMALKSDYASTNKENDLLDVFDIALEMIERGYSIAPIDLELSDAEKFILDPNDEKRLIPPFIAVDSLGMSVADTVIIARQQRPFLSKEDVTKRTKLNNSHMLVLSKMGVFNNMQEENQLSLF